MKKYLFTLLLAACAAGTGLHAADLASEFSAASPKPDPATCYRLSGNIAGGHPAVTAKYLVRIDTLVEGGTVSFAVPAGKVLSACITRQGGYSTTVVTDKVEIIPAVAAPGGMAEARVSLPRGKWRLQLFLAVADKRMKYVDGLDSTAVAAFALDSYRRYGAPSGVRSAPLIAHYTDNSYGNMPGARAWTDGFNERFKKIYKVSPEALYPSLFENTGLHAGTDRIKMFSVRDQLNAEGFPGILSAWAAKHKARNSGVPAGAGAPNPLTGPGDGIKYFKYQDLPMCEYSGDFRNGVDGLAITASAAYNYDKAEVICKLCGDFQPGPQNDGEMLYRAAMDAYSRGAGRLMPVGVWADTVGGIDRMDYRRWLTRCEQILRGGRHISQVGVLYPIADLQARYDFTAYAYAGPGDPVRGNDYYNFLRLMTTQARRDFTLLHPEVLDERCVVGNGILRLDNERNSEEYSIVMVPWCNTIYPSNLEKLADFAVRGGTVLFVGCTPMVSAVRGEDNHVQQLVRRIMATGRGHLIEWPDRDNVRQFIASHLPNPDVMVEIVFSIYKMGDHALDARPEAFRDHAYACNYIHKVKDGRDFYFFANPTDCALTVQLAFGDSRVPQVWDPHTGEIGSVESTMQYGRRTVQLELPPVKSAFVAFGD